jgi:hypothetical protein
MSVKQTTFVKYQFTIIAFFAFVLINLFNPKAAYSQIDNNYDLNNSGFRLGIGGGVTTLMTHYHEDPFKGVFIGSLDYDVNPYLSLGLEAQAGTLEGIDDVYHLYYASSTDNYLAGNFNVRVAVGQFSDFYSENGFTDALKRIYIGAGVGEIHTNIKFTYNPGLAATKYGDPQPYGNYYIFPFNFGTNIDLPGVLGRDKVSINPNYQFNYVNSLYLDGFQSSQYSHLKGFYSILSIKLKYKF